MNYTRFEMPIVKSSMAIDNASKSNIELLKQEATEWIEGPGAAKLDEITRLLEDNIK